LDETGYWIELATRAGLKLPSSFRTLRAEADEFLAILTAATRTTKESPT
jgi:hypothetical protein